ncbi:hypothetical protein INR49_024564 [Caranx melampygus]|nr:hypothetical protein INR49_024564 [Caranx melampygus]
MWHTDKRKKSLLNLRGFIFQSKSIWKILLVVVSLQGIHQQTETLEECNTGTGVPRLL